MSDLYTMGLLLHHDGIQVRIYAVLISGIDEMEKDPTADGDSEVDAHTYLCIDFQESLR